MLEGKLNGPRSHVSFVVDTAFIERASVEEYFSIVRTISSSENITSSDLIELCPKKGKYFYIVIKNVPSSCNRYQCFIS